jgi:transcriptional regulator with XRE-family HTH domain
MASRARTTSASAPIPGCDSTSPSDFRKRFGAQVQCRRLAKGWTQAELAERVGISLKYMGEIERGEANSRASLIETLTSKLGWDLLSNEVTASDLHVVRRFLQGETTAVIERMDVVRRLLSSIEDGPIRQSELWPAVESTPSSSPRPRRQRQLQRPQQ